MAFPVWNNPINKRQDFTEVDYPAGTGARLQKYPPGTGENLSFYPNTGCPSPVNGTINPSFTGRLEGAQGLYDFGINVDLDLICYAIKLVGFRGDYQSPAKTATHVHSATKGKNGPPRLAFQNPIGDEYERNSLGCMQGRFTTGLVMEGKDTGEGFTVSQIEANPIGFMADVHSSLAVPGAVRGQFS